MKRLIALTLAVLLLAGCGAKEETIETTAATPEVVTEATVPAETVAVVGEGTEEIAYVSRFDTVTELVLSDDGISVDGDGETDVVYTSHDIIYYENKDAYESGNPYGEGEAWERHSESEAAAHTVVNITAPGAYKVSGTLSAGQIRVDLGADAYDDADAVVELILSDAQITCTVAPAVLFQNVYECDGNWSVEAAKADVDTAAAGANLILEGENAVTGSHVAKIYKDKEDEKKLWKQDGAVYSYMSMNVYGPGKLDLTADNEGMDTEMHLTINGGEIAIRSQDDGINTNEDGVSVTTINGGNVHIIAGLGAEGDGIDSNGYLVINGGTVVSTAHPAADAGLDSDMGSFINGGFVIALGSTMDWAESDSNQVTMNLQFGANQSAEAAVVVTREDGTVIFAYDPGDDEVLAENKRVYSGAILSCANFHVGESYHVYIDGQINGEDIGGVYDPTTISAYSGGIQMSYTGTDVMRRPGGMGFGGQMPEGFDPSKMGEGMEIPKDFDPSKMGEGMELPEGFDPNKRGEGMEMPEDFDFSQMPQGGMGGRGDLSGEPGEANNLFYMQDMVNFFSGLTKV